MAGAPPSPEVLCTLDVQQSAKVSEDILDALNGEGASQQNTDLGGERTGLGGREGAEQIAERLQARAQAREGDN